MLDPVASVPKLYGVVLAGGSAFGLDAVAGVVRFLKERGIGHPTRGGKVPLVAGAILFDLGVGKADVWPTAACGHKAAVAASDGPVAEGSVGAGAGATIGKLGSLPRAMKGGIGTAALTLPSGLTVAALVAVNAVGDVVDPGTGRILAGARRPDSDALADARLLVRAGTLQAPPRTAENTTLAVVATNATLTKAEAAKVAQMAHDGFARALSPVHTPSDGDTAFALATGALPGAADITLVGSLAAEMVADAIVRAARQATGVPGFPALRDLRPASESGPGR
jgi:L-aminopeptidase/D-esterase-like protein